MWKLKEKKSGISLLSLVITIVVLIILLSISIAVLTGESGILSNTERAKKDKNKSEEKEAVEWAAAQTVGDSEIGKVEKDRFKSFLDEYLGDGKDKGFDYVIDGNYTGIFVVEFTTSRNKYTVDDNGNVYDGEQGKRDGIVLSPTDVTINVDETVKITYSTESDDGKVKWSTENDGIAKVDKDGNVTGVSNGSVTITATTEKGKTAECYVTVQTRPTGLKIEPTEVTIDLSSASRLVPITTEIIPSTANVETGITWSTSKADVAEVEDGIVTGKSNGDAIITARTENGIEATCKVIVQTSPSGLNLNVTNATLDVTDDPTLDLIATLVAETSNISKDITWSSNKPEVAKVDGNGNKARVTALSNGEVEITATTSNGQSITCKITVHTSPSKITISEQNILLDLSDPTVAPNSKNLVVTIYPETADLRNITWKSSASNVATATGTGKDNATGAIKGVANGTTTITATSVNGRTATCNVTVQTTPLSVSLNKTSATLDLSGTKTVQLTATLNPSTANVNTGLTWTSSNTSVATVSSNGLVTGVSNGSANITVRTQNGKTATCNITVQTSPTSVTLNQTSATLDLSGTKTLQLTASINPSTSNVSNNLTWSSSNSGVATVSNSGLVTGVANGSTTITVRTGNGKTANCSIVVQTSITSLTVSPTSGEISVGETIQLSATKTPSTTTEGITWTSSNTSVATVNSSGLVTGKASGTVTITVKSSSGNKSATATIKCYPKYTISYNANGGTGAPESQTKRHGIDITLSSTKPTRSGYTFQGWATSAAGTVAYKPGATYSANTNLSLYAVWKEGDSKGPIKLVTYNGGESSYGFTFIWENIETCSLEGIKIESSSPAYNSYTNGRKYGSCTMSRFILLLRLVLFYRF